MSKNKSINTLVLFITLAFVSSGCMGPSAPPPQQLPQQVKEAEAPDYNNIDNALTDSSSQVRQQAAKSLSDIKHSSAVPKLIQVIKDNRDDMKVIDVAAQGLVGHGDNAVNLVKENLWNDEDVINIYAAYKVLSRSMDKEEFIPEAVSKFYEVPYSLESKQFRQEMVKFILRYTDKEKIDITGDIVTMLQDDDEWISKRAAGKLAEWKDPAVLKSIVDLYYIKRDNEKVVNAILDVLNAYPVPDPKKPEQETLYDISVFLETFGSYNRRIQEASYKGLKNFAYNDPEGMIVNYIKKFGECDNALVRTNVIDLVQVLSTSKWPENLPVPTFEIPSEEAREGYCD